MAQIIPEAWEVPLKFRQRLGAAAGAQRAMVEQGHLLLILHEVPGANELERSARLFWRAPDGTWKATGGRGEGNGLAVLKRHLESFKEAIRKFDEGVDAAVEKGATRPEPFFEVITAATPVQRTTRNLHKALQQAREGVDDKDIITLRDLANDLERAVDNVVADARTALEFSVAKNAEAQASEARRSANAQHRLNLLAALFFPVTAIGTILGSELPTGLEGAPVWVFWSLVAAAFGIGFYVRSTVER